MKSLIISCVISCVIGLFCLTSTSNAHDGPVRKVVRGTVCTTCKVAAVPVRVVKNTQPVRTVVRVAENQVRRVVYVSLLPVRYVFGR